MGESAPARSGQSAGVACVEPLHTSHPEGNTATAKTGRRQPETQTTRRPAREAPAVQVVPEAPTALAVLALPEFRKVLAVLAFPEALLALRGRHRVVPQPIVCCRVTRRPRQPRRPRGSWRSDQTREALLQLTGADAATRDVSSTVLTRPRLSDATAMLAITTIAITAAIRNRVSGMGRRFGEGVVGWGVVGRVFVVGRHQSE